MKKSGYLRRFFSYYKPYKGLFAADVCAAFLISVCDLVYPIITRAVINDFVPNRLLRAFLVCAAALGVIYLIKMGLNYFVIYYGHQLGVRIQGAFFLL